MKRRLAGLGAILLAVSLSGCIAAARHGYDLATGRDAHHHRRHHLSEPPPLILISIDGFRADYLGRGVTPNLKALADEGAHAVRMAPSFPSLTFPNHYTLVTGLYPDHHGIVNNTFEDPAIPPGRFRIADKTAVTNGEWWNEATPIWVSAERQGVKTATEFWPGSEAAIQGVRPSYFTPFDQSVPSDARVDKVLGWLDLPPEERPQFLTLYFDIVDTAAHHHGPDSPEVNAAAATVDKAIGRLVAGLQARGVEANLIIVADHGMVSTPADHHIFVDDWADPASFRIVTLDAVAGLVPADAAAQARLVGHHDHADCYPKAQISERLHYGTNARIPPVVCIADVGWLLTTHAKAARGDEPLGEHGYDPDSPLMGALFIGSGPAFRSGVTLQPFPNVDVYSLEARLMGVTPEASDGSITAFLPALR
jgi:predicted AlkP superfamily pyrophosphatase or phosphodiesterase